MAAKSEGKPIQVKQQFQRSVRLDLDFERSDALNAYILQASPRNALLTVARHVQTTQQRAFTWTGPYGGGKSSLALALAQLAGGSPAVRKAARDALNVQAKDEIAKVFCGKKPWLVLPVVGRRQSAELAIGEVIDKVSPQRGRKPMKHGKRDVIGELVRRSESADHGGVLVILDEMGKLLEAAIASGDDVFFFQELAERVSKANGRVVVVGVLHQAFDQYASRSSRDVQAEWAKVQGRYVDIPIVAATDEVIELIGGAISCSQKHPASLATAKIVAAAIERRRPSSPGTLYRSLDQCWPLHPATAALLGPSSRRKFGQNERSVFGFLTSAEPKGFQDFLQETKKTEAQATYLPARYWDYLRANLEPAIMSSPDGHRWAVIADAVERTQARFHEPHVSLVKTVGLIELFRDSSGVAAEKEVLACCLESSSPKEVEKALEELAKASILIFRKHLQAWGVFAGSDFDIEAAVSAARAGTESNGELQLKTSAVLAPISARRHYSETGTLRWFERTVAVAHTASPASVRSSSMGQSCGQFILLLPSRDCSVTEAKAKAMQLSEQDAESGLTTIYGVPVSDKTLVHQASELAALMQVAASNPSLDGDPVARREVNTRLQKLRSDLEGALRDAFSDATWYFAGKQREVNRETGLSRLASEVCDEIYPHCPRVKSELVNRDVLSTSAAKAQRALMHRMIAFSNEADLGYVGYPADAGLYYTTIDALGIHQVHDGRARFTSPSASKDKDASETLMKLWSAIRDAMQSSESQVSLAQVYSIARERPYGLKQGLLPLIVLAFVLAHRSEIAVYVEGAFTPELTEAGLDEWLQEAERISFKWVRTDANTKRMLTQLASRLAKAIQRPVAADPLDSARALVSFAMSLPAWTQRTSRLSDTARKVRTTLLRASDPVKVIFVDLPEQLGVDRKPDKLVEAIGKVVEELDAAYLTEMRAVEQKLYQAIDHSGDLEVLRTRAKTVQGISGDFKMDAFASRLRVFSASLEDIEGLVSLATNKPGKEFNDHDLDQAMLQIAKWAFEFRKVEALAGVQGRAATRRAFAVVFGGRQTVSGTFDVSVADSEAIEELVKHLLQRVTSGKVGSELFLAALAEAGARVLQSQSEESVK